MPIGLVSDSDLQSELDRLSGNRVSSNVPSTPVTEVVIEDIPTKGRNKGDTNVPESLRRIIGETSVIDGRQAALDIAKQFGISDSQVSAYANGATSTATYDTPSKSLIAHINKSRQRAIKKAQHTLNSALGAITQDKLDYTDAKDLASIAKDMTVVIKNLEPEKAPSEGDAKQTPQFVIFAPQFRDERTFEHITLNE